MDDEFEEFEVCGGQQLGESAGRPYSNSEYVKRMCWEWVQRLMILPSPRRAYGWRRFWIRLFGATISSTARTRPTTKIMYPWLLVLGEHASLGDDVLVYNLGPIRIGDNTLISQRVHLCGGTHDHSIRDMPLVRSSISIGSGVWVCAEAYIGPGITVHNGALIGARAVVVQDVPKGMVAVGNPAKIVKERVMRPSSS